MSYNFILSEANELEKEFADIRRCLHAHAESGFSMPYTVGLVRSKLKEYGYTPYSCGRAGICATVGSGGKVFLLRADMDALRMSEETELDFASESGNMHACGHDMHTAMLLCAAKILKAHESKLCGTVKLMFQPAEEILAGAKDMIDSGVLSDPKVDAALMIHVLAGVPVKAGAVIFPSESESAPSADHFKITVKGSACHGSSPQNGRDALLAACYIMIALQEISSRELGIADRAVITVGKMEAGSAPNAIAEKAELFGTVRAYGTNTSDMLKKRIVEICRATASAFRTEAAVSFDMSCPVLKNDMTLCSAVMGYCAEILPVESLLPAESVLSVSGGSEDFAYVSQRVPSLSLSLCAGQGEYPLHHPKVRFDESVIPIGASIYAHTAMRWLEGTV